MRTLLLWYDPIDVSMNRKTFPLLFESAKKSDICIRKASNSVTYDAMASVVLVFERNPTLSGFFIGSHFSRKYQVWG